MTDKKVPMKQLYQCKLCGVKMFSVRCSAHLEDNHGLFTENWKSYFLRAGKVPTRPGDNFTSKHYQSLVFRK